MSSAGLFACYEGFLSSLCRHFLNCTSEVPDGEKVLRLKIDMASPNLKLRDPTVYRVKRDAEHPRTGTKWKVYPMSAAARGRGDSNKSCSFRRLKRGRKRRLRTTDGS